VAKSSRDVHLSTDQLCDIALAMAEWIGQGLANQADTTRCLPTFVCLDGADPSGLAYALDLGGSNLRAAVVRIGGTGRIRLVRGPVGRTMPWQRGKPFAREHFLSTQTELIAQIALPQPLPLGYCFSYPALSTPDRDAILTRWTKEIDVPDMVGQKVGRLLSDRLAARGITSGRVTVVNDTVAALMAGIHGSGADIHIGQVVGTGANMAALMPAARIAAATAAGMKGLVPVNLESGNFHPPHLAPMDQALDADSSEPGRQRLEKAVSGAYLGKLLALCHPQAPIDTAAGALVLMDAMGQGQTGMARSAWRLYRRSALLTAAALAGLIVWLTLPASHATVRIAAEGALMWSRPPGKPAYARLVGRSLKQVLGHLGRPAVRARFCRRPEANLRGSALAALIP